MMSTSLNTRSSRKAGGRRAALRARPATLLALALALAAAPQPGCELGSQPVQSVGGDPVQNSFLNNTVNPNTPAVGRITLHWQANHEGMVNSVGGGYLVTIVGVGNGLAGGLTAPPSLAQLPPGVFPGVPIRFNSFGGELSPDLTTCGPLACSSNCTLTGGSWNCAITNFPLTAPMVYEFSVQAFGTFTPSAPLSVTPPGCVVSGLQLICTSAAGAFFGGSAL